MPSPEHPTPHWSHRIAGDARPVGRLRVTAPYDGRVIGTVDQVDAAAVEQALVAAQALFDDRTSWLPTDQRMAILSRTAALLSERAEVFAVEAAREGGKPLIDSRVEVARAVDGLRNCAELIRSSAGVQVPMGVTRASRQRLAFTHHEPIGPVFAISAFNHPLNLIVHQTGPAIAAGCPVVVKPAEATPLSCLRLIDLLRESGLPPGWAQALLTDGHDTTARLVADPRVAFFSFIGSARVGWSLRSRLAPGTRCALEHGGAAPVLVDRDTDLDAVVP
ncbi:MAG: aldehyde dehydrogenase family protein, partial [Thiohalocapsa sp.]